MAKKRVPMQVSPSFEEKLKELQRKIRATGRDISLRDLTEEIAGMNSLIVIEEKLLQKKLNDINLKLDRRKGK